MPSATSLLLTLLALTTLTLYATYRRALFTLNTRRPKPLRHGRRNPKEPTHLLIVLGSGGHTAEMLAMLDRAVNESDPLKRLDWRDYGHRTWVVGEGDTISAARAREFEDMATALSSQETLMAGKVKKATDAGPGKFDVLKVPRARAIHQPLSTTPVSAFKCFAGCWKVLTGQVAKGVDFPDLILVNGPATGAVMVYTSLVMRFFNVRGCVTSYKMRTIHVESYARVKKLSLSGRLLCYVTDKFLVQWPALDARRQGAGRAQFAGVLV